MTTGNLNLRQSLLRAAVAAALAGSLASTHAWAEDFDWRNISGQNFVTAVRDQGQAGTCWTFAATSVAESRYLLTRNDPGFNFDLSEQYAVMVQPAGSNAITGGSVNSAWKLYANSGVVLESELQYTASAQSGQWPLQAGWENRVVKIDGGAVTSALNNPTALAVKTALKNYGPLSLNLPSDNQWYPNPGTYRGQHAVTIVGFHDEAGVPGGGYFFIKNSWGAGWNGDGFGKVSYQSVSTDSVDILPGSAYYTGALQTATWTGGSTWSTGVGSWTQGVWRNGEDAAVFSTAGGPVTVAAQTSAHSLTFNPGATGYAFSGGNLIVTAGGLVANESVAFNNPLTIGAPQTWNVGSGKTVTVNNTLNTHISTLTVNGTGNTVVNSVIRDVQTDPSGLLRAYHGGLVKDGSGTLTLNAANTYTGTTRVKGGVLALGNANALSGSTLDLNVADTGQIDFGTMTDLTLGGLSGSRALASVATPAQTFITLTVGGNDVDASYTGALSSITNLTKTGTGVQAIGGSNTYTGTTSLNGGFLSISAAANLGAAATPINFNGGGLQITGTALSNLNSHGFVVQPSAGLRLNISDANNTFSLNQVGTAAGGLVKGGSGTLILAGNNSFGAGTLALNGGTLTLTGTNACAGVNVAGLATLSISSDANIGGSTSALSVKSGSTIRLTGTTLHTLDNHAGLWESFASIPQYGALQLDIVDLGNTLAIGRSLSGNAGITTLGNGLLSLSAANTFSGTTAVKAGTLRVDHSAALQNSSVELSGGANLTFGTATTATFAGLTSFVASGDRGGGAPMNAIRLENAAFAPVALTIDTRTVGGRSGPAYDGALTGAGALIKTGSGTFVLSAVNSYTGSTTIQQGTLRLATTGNLGSASTIQLAAGSTYQVDVASGGQYAQRPLRSQLTGPGALETQAQIIEGGNNVSFDLQAFSMDWRTRTVGEQGTLRSDVLNLTSEFLDGKNNVVAGVQHPVFVLSMHYDAGTLSGSESDLRLMWLDDGNWNNAAMGNTTLSSQTFYSSPYSGAYFYLGNYGVDVATDTVWAVLDHNSSFAVGLVPEPGSLTLLGLASALAMLRRSRRSDGVRGYKTGQVRFSLPDNTPVLFLA